VNETSTRRALAQRLHLPLYARRIALFLLVAAVLLWDLAPGVRAFTLVANLSRRAVPSTASAGIPVQETHFAAADGVRLAGWLALASPTAPTVILVHGFKSSRVSMLPWARFLYATGYNVLLYDSRGCGESEGWSITLGAREPADVVGAVHYLQARPDLKLKRFGALGISLGAGIVLSAAAREPALSAVVADSAWADEDPQLDRMGSVPVGPLALPVLPYEPAVVDALIGAHLASARPVDDIGRIASRAMLLIHSADDQNATTPLSGERRLYAAAGQPKQQWIAPSGGHTGALFAHSDEYERRVLDFFGRYLSMPATSGA
jgi:pimeloyl-ACP methyl ester carboxylesterase